MKITPRQGYVLVSNQDIEEEKKVGLILMPNEDKKKTYLRLESDGELYKMGDCVFAQPFKSKMQIEDNLFLIAEEDIVAKFIIEPVPVMESNENQHVSVEYCGELRCMTSDGRIVNAAEELNERPDT